MKKVLCIIALIVLIASYATFSMAAELSISLSPNKQKVEQGAEVKVSITLNGFTRQGNQKAVEAKVVYDEKKLEYKNISWNNGWTGSISTDGTGLAANKSGQVSDSETIAEITYLVKENATLGTSEISVRDVLTSSDGDEVTVSNGQTSIEIVKPGVENENPGGDDNPGGNENPGEDNPNQKVLTDIEITTEPTKKSYKEGEKFDKTGMKVIAKYSDGTTKEITNYTYTPNGNLKTTDTQITISYEESGATKTVKIPITVLSSNSGNSNQVNGNNSNQNGKDGTTSEKNYPYTGVKDFILPIGIALIVVVVSYLGYRKYKDI